jgi:mRNA-degrading endonuclease RelE of RelBE toxin-antitoxin system
VPQVLITPAAQAQFEALPLTIQARVLGVFQRLADFPNVSGAKPLQGEFSGSYRIRTGDYRIVFRPEHGPNGQSRVVISVIVWRIGNRRDVYLD